MDIPIPDSVQQNKGEGIPGTFFVQGGVGEVFFGRGSVSVGQAVPAQQCGDILRRTRCRQPLPLGGAGDEHHPRRYRPAVGQAEMGLGFQGVAQGMAEIEQAPFRCV